ncbi:cleavage polyadenylation factor subunit [Martiniozyma asiatica (nom. inval.)]|nr:cleavage polyadenylation factor subunit [Martiniozyma asiatica]
MNTIGEDGQGDDKKSAYRRTVDYFTPLGRHIISKNVLNKRRKRQHVAQMRPDSSYLQMLPFPVAANYDIVDIPTKFVHVSTNKSKHAIHAIKWTPDARRVLVSSYSGEFTVWNGLTFNFESIMQAHDSPIFTLEYSHNGRWLISGDQAGCIKYWQPNFNNVNIINTAHDNAIQDLKFSPNDKKFVSCSDDQYLKIWDFGTAQEEQTFKGHHWDIKSCDWHPSLGLIVSASKDNLVKFWDPRDGSCIQTLHDFKHTVTKATFQRAGNQRLMAACSRDHSTRIFDVRMMKAISVLRSENDSDLSSLSWHPIHANILTIGGYDGSLIHQNVSKSLDMSLIPPPEDDSQIITESKAPIIHEPWHKIPHAHDKAIYSMEYHPLGHLLCTAGADKSMRFWSRGRPNDAESFREPCYIGGNTEKVKDPTSVWTLDDENDDLSEEITSQSQIKNKNKIKKPPGFEI